MRTTITLDDDVHEFASYYADAKRNHPECGNERTCPQSGEAAGAQNPKSYFLPDGFPMFPPVGNGRVVTDEMVKKFEEEEFDPEKFA